MKGGIFLTFVAVSNLITIGGLGISKELVSKGEIALAIIFSAVGAFLLVWGIQRIKKARAGIPNTDLWGH